VLIISPFFCASFLRFSLCAAGAGIFLVLDRAYVLPLPGVRPLWEAGLACLRTHLAAHPALTTKTVRGLLGAIERERGGEGTAARPLLKSLLRLLAALVRARARRCIAMNDARMRCSCSPLRMLSLPFFPAHFSRAAQGIYGDAFERPFLEASASFYAAESSLTLSQTDVPGYLLHAEARLVEESERCGAFLEPATRKPLTAAVERALVAAHVPTLLDKGFGELMAAAAHRVPDLARLYALLGRVGAHDALRAALSRRVCADTDTRKCGCVLCPSQRDALFG
jgi:cullin-4